MSLPKIDLRFNIFREVKLNLMAVIIIDKNNLPVDEIYVASEISHLIGKLMFNTNVYGDLSRLFKISLPRNVKMVQVIIIENLSNEELIRQRISGQPCCFTKYFTKENFTEINFKSSSSWLSCGLEEYLTLPIKSLTLFGTELIAKGRQYDTGVNLKQLTPQVLLSTPTEMHWDGVPSPDKIHLEQKSQYIFSQFHYIPPSNDPRSILAIDCEMVNTGDENDLALARVSVVRCGGDMDLTTSKGVKEWLANGSPYDVVYDEFVKPQKPILDYKTQFSGITAKTLENVVLTLNDVHTKMRSIIKPDTIIVGHSVHMDLKALRLYHPYIIDTSTIYNSSGDANHKPSLQSLAKDILKCELRKRKKSCGHDSVEDAYTSLKLIMFKLLKDMNFGNKTRNTYVKPQNTLLGDWKDVPGTSMKTSIKQEVMVKKVELCRIDWDDGRDIQEQQLQPNGDIQSNIDKFILLSEQPAVIKTPELMYALSKSMHLIVNVNGIIGRSLNEGPCVLKETSDQNVAIKTLENVSNSDLLVSVLSAYSDVIPGSTNEQRLAQFSSLTNNIETIVNGAALLSAILVILPGQYGCESTGKLYWKIK